MTVELQSCENLVIELTKDSKLKFGADSNQIHYEFDMELFAAVDKEESRWNTKGRNVIFNLVKKEKDEEYWPRLSKDKTKNSRITIDWAKWVDEDEEDEQPEGGMGDMDPSMMQGFGGGAGGMPGMGGMGGMPDLGAMGGMGGMPGMGGMGGMPEGMDMAKLQEMMKNMGGAGGMPGMDAMGGMGGPDSDDEEEEEAAGEPKKDDGLGDLDAEAEK